MQIQHFRLTVWVAALLLAGPNIGHAATAVPDFNVGGIPPPGFPDFSNTASIALGKTGVGADAGYQLVSGDIPGSFSFQYSPTLSYNVSGNFSLSATASAGGAFSGSFAINGTVPDYNGPGTPPLPSKQNLFSGTIAGLNADVVGGDGTPVAVGFVTTGFSGWASQFSTGSAESIYLSDFNVPWMATMANSPKFKNLSLQGSALTTVPLPAAVWLFGSACGLLACVRRNKAPAA